MVLFVFLTHARDSFCIVWLSMSTILSLLFILFICLLSPLSLSFASCWCCLYASQLFAFSSSSFSYPMSTILSVFLILLIYLLSLSLSHSLRVAVVFAAVYHSLSIMATLFLRGRGGCECGCPRLMNVSKAGSVFVQRF